jgi:hypothetical protein
VKGVHETKLQIDKRGRLESKVQARLCKPTHPELAPYRNWNFIRYRQNLRPINNLLLQLGTRKEKDIGNNGVNNKVIVGAKFSARKRRDTVNQQRGSFLDIPGQQFGQGTVDLQTIASVPVASVVGEFRRLSGEGGEWNT